MIVWLISKTWNAKKLLPYFLRSYSLFCDKIILYDFMSDDETEEIAKSNHLVDFRQTGKKYEFDVLNQTAWINEIYKEARGQADWVIMPDPDEFLYCETGVREALQDYMEQGINLPHISGYHMFHDELPDTDGQLWEKYKLGIPHIMENKPIVFNPNLDIRFGHGQHNVMKSDTFIRSDKHPLKLLHYRYWGYADLVDVNQKMWNSSSPRSKGGGHGGYNPKDTTSLTYNSIGWWEDAKKERVEVI